MGAVQEPTPGMGPYRTEIRRESFRLTVAGPTAQLPARRTDRHTLCLPLAHAPHVLAALDQVTDHPAWQRWPGTPRTRGVVVTVDGDVLVMRTPHPVYADQLSDDAGNDTVIVTELDFADIDALRAQLHPHT